MAVKKILFRLRVAKGWTTRINKRESENEREKVQENEQMSKKNVYRVYVKEKEEYIQSRCERERHEAIACKSHASLFVFVALNLKYISWKVLNQIFAFLS